MALLLGLALFASLALALPVGAQDGNATGTDGNATGADGNATGADGNATGGDGAAVGGGDLGVPADAPTPAEGKITRVLTFGSIDEGTCPGGLPAPCWDVTVLVAEPGDVVVLHANLVNRDVPHNLHIIEPGSEPEAAAPGPKTRTSGNALHTASFTMPESGGLTFICDVHPEDMVAQVLSPTDAAALGAHVVGANTLGVHFLAYWVGVIAFAILFVVYGATFFLFKYNETRATTDHWDRSDAGGENKRLAAIAPLLAVVIGVVAVAAIVYMAAR